MGKINSWENKGLFMYKIVKLNILSIWKFVGDGVRKKHNISSQSQKIKCL